MGHFLYLIRFLIHLPFLKKAAEWAATKKEKSASVKAASKEVKTLTAAKGKALNVKLKEIDAEEKANIKAIKADIKGLEKELKALIAASAAEE